MPFEPRYAHLYDAIYAAKDYAFEVGQVLEFARQYGVEVRTIVDYGCGRAVTHAASPKKALRYMESTAASIC